MVRITEEEDPDPDQDLREDFADFERDDEADQISAQKPIDTLTSSRFRPPGTHIEASNHDALERASQQRVTVGTESADILPSQSDDEGNYNSSRASFDGKECLLSPSSQLISLNTRTLETTGCLGSQVKLSGTEKFGGTGWTGFDSKAPSIVAEEHDPMASDGEEVIEDNEPAQKRSLKDLVTKVPKSNQDMAQA